MRYRQLANAGLKLSEVGFGVWTVSTAWWGIQEESVGISLLKKAFDLGITFFDTADTYGNGLGETILAKALRDRRDQIVIGTKVGYDFYHHTGRRGQEELPQDFSPQYLEFALGESLKRLQTDVIDLYQLHNSRIDVIQRDEVIETLERFKSQGKIRSYGVALGPAIAERQIDEGKGAVEKRFHSIQIIYNLLEQMLGEQLLPPHPPLSPLGGEEKGEGVVDPTSFLVRVPHASGLLDGTVRPETTFTETDHRFHRVSTDEKKRLWQEEGLKKVEQLRFLIEGTGRTIGQAALKFILSEPSVASVLPNIYNEQLLTEFARTSDVPDLTPEELTKIRELYASNFGLAPAVAS